MKAAAEHAANLGTQPMCKALGVSRASYYRRKAGRARGQESPRVCFRRTSRRALTVVERGGVLEVLHGERFQDRAPAEVYATLLDEGRYLCSPRTMYRVLDSVGEVRERRNQLRHPRHPKPQLLATRPNQVWTWDITKMLLWVKWKYLFLYVLLDIFSRYVVGWMLALRESAALGGRLIGESYVRQNVREGEVTVHSDNGGPMRSKTVAQLLVDLEVRKSFSRPRVSNDNPYSEAHFKTVKYHPEFPEAFEGIEEAEAFFRLFFRWYNTEHRHSGIGYLTPEAVHYGRAAEVVARRREVLAAAYARNPDRFVRGMPSPTEPPREVWINPPFGVEPEKVVLVCGTEM